jgi:hypothetical protein
LILCFYKLRMSLSLDPGLVPVQFRTAMSIQLFIQFLCSLLHIRDFAATIPDD